MLPEDISVRFVATVVLFWIVTYDEMHSWKKKSNTAFGTLLLNSKDIHVFFHVAFKTMAEVTCILLSTELQTLTNCEGCQQNKEQHTEEQTYWMLFWLTGFLGNASWEEAMCKMCIIWKGSSSMQPLFWVSQQKCCELWNSMHKDRLVSCAVGALTIYPLLKLLFCCKLGIHIDVVQILMQSKHPFLHYYKKNKKATWGVPSKPDAVGTSVCPQVLKQTMGTYPGPCLRVVARSGITRELLSPVNETM